MNLKGNNAEKLATTLIIFFVLLISYILISFAFAYWSTPSWPSMVKDGMGFAVTGITPVIAILLFNDWREQHNAIRNENISNNVEKTLDKLVNYLHLPYKFDDISQLESKQYEFFIHLSDLRNNIKEINISDYKADEYKKNLEKVIRVLRSSWDDYVSLVIFHDLANKEADQSEKNPVLKTYIDKTIYHQNEKDSKLQNYRSIKKELRPLQVKQ